MITNLRFHVKLNKGGSLMVRHYLALALVSCSLLFALAITAARGATIGIRKFASAILATVFAPEPFRFRDDNPRSIFETRRLGLC